jgi:hypothetical protein
MSIWQKILPVILILAIAGIGGAGYFYYKYQKAQLEIQTIKTDPSTVQKAAQEEAKQLVSSVAQLIELPQGEDPTVATITDIDKLKDQPFFQKAKNGDKVLIYTNAKKAILYSPSSNKVIDVAPVNIGSSSAQQAQGSASPAPQAKIVIRNGTSTTGITSKIETDLKKAFPQANVVAKDNSPKSDYEKTTVVVLNDSAKDAADALAKSLNATVGTLPQEEQKPNNADVLIIVGKDKASS